MLRFGLISGRREAITEAPAKVSGVIPEDLSIHIQLDQVIYWTRPARAQSYDVWIGPNAGALVKVSDGQLATSYVPTLALDSTYYIRIDAINIIGTTTGDVTSFSTWNEADIWSDVIDSVVVPWTDGNGNYIPHIAE